MSPVRGIVLAGGFSRRMGTEKATLVMEGRTLLDRAVDLLGSLGLPLSVCLRPGQEIAGIEADRIDDPEPSIGPAGGVLAAMAAHPDNALLVIPVDLPDLDPTTVRQLLDHRSPTASVTAFLSPGDGRVDPLCAVYEPASRSRIEAAVAEGMTSLRQILEIQGDVSCIKPVRPEALFDVDTPADLSRAASAGTDLNHPCRPST